MITKEISAAFGRERLAVCGLVFALGACAGPMIFEKPGGTQEQFRADSYNCEQNAEMLARLRNPDRSGPNDKPGAQLGAAIGRGLAMGMEKRSEYKKCMESRGYAEVKPPKS